MRKKWLLISVRGGERTPGPGDWSTPLLHPTASADRAPPDGHVMPPPTAAPSPWTSAGVAWGSAPSPHIMQFTAHTPQRPALLHCKRKPPQVDPVIPSKQFITEEKMAAHLSGLHISHEYKEHGDEPPTPAAVPEEMEVSTEAHKWLKGARTIVLAEEIKRLQNEPLLPPSILKRLEKPCMSLMVWRPKEDLLSSGQDEEDETTTARNPSAVSRRRNGVLVTETSEVSSNSMDVEM